MRPLLKIERNDLKTNKINISFSSSVLASEYVDLVYHVIQAKNMSQFKRGLDKLVELQCWLGPQVSSILIVSL